MVLLFRVFLSGQCHGKQGRQPGDIAQADLVSLVRRLNADPTVHGILVQLPLPGHLDTAVVLDEIDPAKDVDGLHPDNLGLLADGRPRFLPCTPQGVWEMGRRSGIDWSGKRVAILGRSSIVGKSLALVLLQKGADVKLPLAANTAEKPETQDQTVVAVDKSDRIFVNGLPVRKEELRQKVEEVLETKKERIILIKADEDARYSAVMDLMPEYNFDKSKEIIEAMGDKWCCHPNNHIKKLEVPLPILNEPRTKVLQGKK